MAANLPQSESKPVDEPVIYELEGAVAWMTLNRPATRNALNQEIRDALWDGFRRFRDCPESSVLVLTGRGERAFCAGGDLKEMATTGMQVPPDDYLPYLGRSVITNKPVIAAVNGDAFGGGFLLTQMADLCIAADHARFGIPEARWGRGSPWAAPLPWLIPPRIALEMILTGQPIDAARAQSAGLVNTVIPAADLLTEARQLAQQIAANAPLSVQAGKAMVYSAADLGWQEALDQADRLYQPVYLSEDAQEGPRAFRERRPPRWLGR